MKAKLLRLVFDTAALRGFGCPACGAFAELIYFAGRRPIYEQHEEQ
ncbi:MAG: hypothetical protein WDN00_01140 [Limisphaerales bacterium]